MVPIWLRMSLLFGVLCVCIGCGGLIGGVTEIIEMVPPSATLQQNGTQNLQVAVVESGANEVEWSILEPSGGNIQPDGLNPPLTAVYTAPATQGTYHVRARVVTNNREKTVECVITVGP
jgi:hypothetical protein